MTRLPYPELEKLNQIRKGLVIPASPLALNADKKLDEKFQKAIYRYYLAAGAGGIAIGVHTTQFEIREPGIDLFKPLLKFAVGIMDEYSRIHQKHIVKIAGICGKTEQAIAEADYAAQLGYDIGLVSLGALKNASEDVLINHCRSISKIIPIMGFYLQPSVGGRILSHQFWRKLSDIGNLVAIKIAPFNRYQSLDVIRAVALSGREKEIILYTGNDDNIIMDLLTPYPVMTKQGEKNIRIKGGLLGQWAVWTKRAVELISEIHQITEFEQPIPIELLKKNVALTDANSVIFDAANNFLGCIAGIHEILHRQGLMQYTHCIKSTNKLSAGQSEQIDRIYHDYPFLTDDDFIKENLTDWLDE